MLANETGKDLYFSISSTADHDYFEKLANLIKYGSDGVNPYTSVAQWPSTGPLYPPLNPNLRFYIEYSNEVWNFSFGQFAMAKLACNDAIAKKTPDGLIVNYDGHGNDSFERWQTLQTVNISNAFRSVFGDAAMGDRVRVLLFDQYGVFGKQLGQFIDSYFNKSDPKSTYTGTPHPVSYYIWGGGGAIYYGSNHPTGIDPDVHVDNASFESPILADGASQADPPAGPWNFSGNAGIYHNIARRQAVASPVLGVAAAPAQQGWVGFKFTVGANPIYVYDVGRLEVSDDQHPHLVNIFKADGSGLLANSVSPDGPADKYEWTRVIEQGWTRNPEIPLKLEANTAYYIMSHEDGPNGDTCYAHAKGLTAPGITVNCSVTSPEGPFKPNEGSDTATGPVDFTFSDTPLGDFGFPCDASDGVQSAFIGDTGTMSQTINFSKTGTFALGFNAAIKPGFENPIDIYVDGVKYTPISGGNPSWKPSTSPWLPGGFERRPDDLALWWGSATFPITQTGQHKIEIRGTGKAGQYMFFDNMKIVSSDGIYGPDCSYFPSMGEANGEDPRGGLDTYVNTLHNEINWTIAWGLKTMAYEGGWSVGGDFDQKPIHSYCKYVCPETIAADAKAIGVYTSGGGVTVCYFYPQWPDGDLANATQHPLVQAVIKRNDLLPMEADYGTLIPNTIPPGALTLSSDNSDHAGNLPAQGDWMDWNIIAPITQTYRVTGSFSNQGGAAVLLIDDGSTVASGNLDSGLTGTIKLTKGQHTIKIRNTGATSICVKDLNVIIEGSPAAPSLSKCDFENNKCTLTWTAVPSATDYIVHYGTTSGNYASMQAAGNATSATLSGLDNSSVYYATVQASKGDNLLSPCSNEMRIAQRSSDPQALIDFEDQPVSVGQPDLKHPTNLVIQNYRFTAVRTNSTEKSVLTIDDDKQGSWSSHVLNGLFWGTCQRIERADARPFDLYSLDLCTSSPFSCVIVGYDPSGATFSKVINITPSDGKLAVVPVTLDWPHVARVDIQWWEKPNGGGDVRNGAIDNVLVDRKP